MDEDLGGGDIGCLLYTSNTNPNAGLLQLTNAQGVPQEAVSLCRIVSVRITSAKYNNDITYLPVPSPAPTGCGANCEAAIRAYLPAGTIGVSINAGGQTVAQGTVLRSEFGMLVVVCLLYTSTIIKLWSEREISYLLYLSVFG